MFLAFAAPLMPFFSHSIVTNVAFHQNGNPCPSEQQGQLLAPSQKSVTDSELGSMLPDLIGSRHNALLFVRSLNFHMIYLYRLGYSPRHQIPAVKQSWGGQEDINNPPNLYSLPLRSTKSLTYIRTLLDKSQSALWI